MVSSTYDTNYQVGYKTYITHIVCRYNGQLRDIAFNKVIHYNIIACLEFYAQVQIKINSLCILYYIITRSILAIAWQDSVVF